MVLKEIVRNQFSGYFEVNETISKMCIESECREKSCFAALVALGYEAFSASVKNGSTMENTFT